MPDPLDDPMAPGYDDPLVGGMTSGQQRQMTHKAPAPNPAAPYLKAAPYLETAKKFAHGGLTEAIPGLREAMPSSINAIGGLVQSRAARDAMSAANVGGLPLVQAIGEKGALGALGSVAAKASPPNAKALASALGKPEFQGLFDSIKDLPREDIVAIAHEFNGPLAPGASKGKALERIWSRHRKLMEFKNDLARGVWPRAS